ncbi:MAG: YbjN domain-containing protein [Clostridia bacterium]|nr:YbjN domain-containing protein [Clostridia bacterium]
MQITASTKSRSYSVLCSALDRNDIFYEVKSDNSVTCVVSAGSEDIPMTFTIDASKMLVTLFAPIAHGVAADIATDTALAVCMINDRISEGAFCFDVNGGLVYYRLTQSYYNRGQSEFLFEYMLSSAASLMEEYRPRLKKLLRRRGLFR